MRFFFLAFASACTPHLTSQQEEITGLNWEAPENSWSVNPPPSTLQGEGFALGDVPHDFRMVDQHGEEVSLWQFYGSVILLDISTMWCGPCQQIARDVNETWEDYREDGFMYITVLPEDLEGQSVGSDDLDEWAENFGIEAPVLADNGGYGYEVEPNRVWPVVMLIDRTMQIVAERITPSDEAIRAAIESEL